MSRTLRAVAVILVVAALSACTEKIENMPEPMPNQTSPEAPRGQ